MGILKMFGTESRKEKEMKQKLLQQQIHNYQRIFIESYKILETTENIETFLSRYSILVNAIEETQKIAGDHVKCFAGLTAVEALEVVRRDMPLLLNPCLERFVRKKTLSICQSSTNRLKKAKALYGLLVAYEEQIPSESLDYWRKLIDKLVNKIEKIEAQEKAQP